MYLGGWSLKFFLLVSYWIIHKLLTFSLIWRLVFYIRPKNDQLLFLIWHILLFTIFFWNFIYHMLDPFNVFFLTFVSCILSPHIYVMIFKILLIFTFKFEFSLYVWSALQMLFKIFNINNFHFLIVIFDSFPNNIKNISLNRKGAYTFFTVTVLFSFLLYLCVFLAAHFCPIFCFSECLFWLHPHCLDNHADLY